jgi:hypothetical protein
MFVVEKNIEIPEKRHNSSIPRNIRVRNSAACKLKYVLLIEKRREKKWVHTKSLRNDIERGYILEVNH